MWLISNDGYGGVGYRFTYSSNILAKELKHNKERMRKHGAYPLPFDRNFIEV